MSDITRWAKIIETPVGQVLFYQEYNADLDRDEIRIVYQDSRTAIRVRATFSKTGIFTQEQFDKFSTEATALKYAESFKRTLEDN